MIYNGNTEEFDISKIQNIWFALDEAQILCDNKNIMIDKKRKIPAVAEKIIRCALERAEDYLRFINNMKLHPNTEESSAFSFIEFLSCESVVIDCIERMADIFDVNTDSIKCARNCFRDFKRGNGDDYNVFKYIRSICVAHPLETSHHASIHGSNNFDCCLRVSWAYNRNKEEEICAYIYSKGNDDFEAVNMKLKWFVDYLKVWLDFTTEIQIGISNYIGNEKSRYANEVIKQPKEFNTYADYIDNLSIEYKRRFGYSHFYLFEEYKRAFEVEFKDGRTKEKLENYRNAIKYMFEYLHKQLQCMDENLYTGIVDLDSNDYTTLFFELCFPTDMKGEFKYFGSAIPYISKLSSGYYGDVLLAREVLEKYKSAANEYVLFKNEESEVETSVLFQIATYFETLKYTGYVGRSIPKKAMYGNSEKAKEDMLK